VQARLSWARYFSFPTEAGVNKVIVNAMGPEIMDEENTMAYDNAFEKIKSWSRQWQYDVLKKLTKHVRKVSATDHKIKLLILVKVRSIWDTEKEIMSDMNPSGLRKHFFRKLNVPTIKEIFHVIDVVVDLDEIFSSAASGLYTTVYANMAAYTLEHRIKPGSNRTLEDDKKFFRAFKDLAHESKFQDIEVEDLPIRARKPANKKRMTEMNTAPLSERDDSFLFFGPPPGTTARLPKKLMPVPVEDVDDDHQTSTGAS
jgi:hypothetical protein